MKNEMGLLIARRSQEKINRGDLFSTLGRKEKGMYLVTVLEPKNGL